MLTLDMRTVILLGATLNLLGLAGATWAWRANRGRFEGTGFWALDFLLQTLGLLLILARGHIPDVVSMVVSNTCVLGGMWALLAGLARFFGKKAPFLPNVILLPVFAAVHTWFAAVHPSLHVRNINVSLGIFALCAQTAWFLWRGLEPDQRPVARPLALAFLVLSALSLSRAGGYLFVQPPSEDFFVTSNLEGLTLAVYQFLNLLVMVSLVLLVNQRLLQVARQSESKYARIFDASPDGVLVTRLPEGIVVDANDALCRLTGYTRAQVLGRTTLDLGFWVQPETRAPLMAELKDLGRIRGKEVQLGGREGQVIDARLSAEPLELDGQPHVLTILEDVRERRRAEEERRNFEATVRHRQSLESMGALAAGVAHEINNPVNVLINYAEIIADDPQVPPAAQAHARSILAEGERIATIAKTLRGQARLGGGQVRAILVRELLQDTLAVSQALLRKETIQVTLQVPEDLPPLRCDPQLVQQVLLNLVANARDAVNAHHPARGDAKTILLRAQALDPGDGPRIRICVEDNGGGIPESVAPRIYDPFFTTKDQDHGTGLGLYVSTDIVREHGGRLHFESTPGQGTRFLVDLPVDGPPPAKGPGEG